MATRKMMQGDSYHIPFKITINDTTDVVPDMVTEMELCIGNVDGAAIRKTFSSDTLQYDDLERRWFFKPTQQETLNLEPGSYDVIVRMKFSDTADADVIGVHIGRISIVDTQSEEVI